MGESNGDPARGDAPAPPRLTAGGVVAGGRYELLELHGGVAGQAFWKARDRRLDRPVALTFVDPLPGETPPGSATGVLDRTVSLTAVYSDGLARVLDVIRGRAGGIVVTEWIPGRSLAAAVAEPRPETAVGAVWGLSDAATIAEEKDLVLGLDSPDRVRVTDDGRAVLAFPGVSTHVGHRSDVRGLGAVLYALLTGAWPLDLPEGSESHVPVDGRPAAAARDDDDKILDPSAAGTGVAPESAVLAMRSLDGTAVSSAATVRAMLADRTGAPVRTTRAVGGVAGSTGAAVLDGAGSSAGLGGAAGAPFSSKSSLPSSSPSSSDPDGPTPGDTTGTASFDKSSGPTDGPTDASRVEASDAAWSVASDEPDPDVQKRHWQIMAGAGAVAVVTIVLLSVWMLGALGGGRNDTPLSQQLDAIEQAAQASRSAEAAAPPAADGGGGADGEGSTDAQAAERNTATTPSAVSTATSWQPVASSGNAENSSSAPNVIDGDPSTSWSTDTYRDQFGTGPSAFKAGVGVMLTLEDAREVRKVELSGDDDFRFEIRSADSATPTSLDDTTRLGSGRVRDGKATVEIDKPAEAGYILVWITRLGTSGPQAYDASITEVELFG